jgi:HlyD family secretion protein
MYIIDYLWTMKKLFIFTFSTLSLLISCKKEKESIQVSSGDITESVYASGKVKAIDQYNVYSTVNGVLQNIVLMLATISLKDKLF